MPGNEGADKLYNFFDQENPPQGQRNSQVARANNLWAGNQRQIGAALISDTKNYNIHHSDLERGNDKQSPQRVFYTNNAQLTSPEFTQGQSRNQELNLNGYIHGHQGLQKRQIHTESGVNEVSGQLKLASRGLSNTEQLRRNAPEHSPPAARTSERVETAETPNSVDLDRQQLLMSNQQPGMSQPRPRQQQGFSDVQLWQQQMMLKQLQELHRQKQLQQLEHGHQNQLNQLSAFAKQGANEQLPAIVNGMPIHGSANYGWQNELSGGDSKVPNSSQMFMAGNTNWAQRAGYMQGIPDGMLSNEQGQILRSMGLVPQQLDQSVYAAHNASTRGAFNPYSHIQGISQDCSDTSNKASANHLEKPVMQPLPLTNSLQGGQSALFSNQASMRDAVSVSRQGLQGKSMFGQIPFQGMSPGVQPGNCMQQNSVSGNALVQDFQGKEQQAGWSGNLQDRGASQVGSSQGLVSLDPTEKKILFSSDDNIWDAFGGKGEATGAGGYGDQLDSSAFPSIQSGTWSALMQSAVAEASSSDTGLQDEWSGLHSHNRELSTVDQPIGQGDSRKQQPDWAANNLQSTSLTSRSFPLFEDGNMTQSGRNASDFQQSGSRNLHEERERLQHDASYETVQQSLRDNGKWLDRSPQQKTYIEGSHQVQPSMNSENAFQSALNRQMHTESSAHATNASPNVNSMQGSWVGQHGVSPHNINSQHGNNTVGWNNDNSLLASRDGILKMSESENRGQHFQRNDLKMGMHLERDHDGRIMMGNSFPNFMDGGGTHQVKRDASFVNTLNSVPNSSATKAIQEPHQQALNNHHLNYRKHLTDSPVNHRDDSMGYNQNPSGSQVFEASDNNSDRGAGESYDKRRENSYQKEFSNDSYNSNQSQPTVSGGGFRENSWLSTSDSRHIARANQNSQVGRKAPSHPSHPRFQFHPMGVEEDLEAADNSKRVAYMQAISQQAVQESKGHEREYFGHSEFNSHASNRTNAMEKEHIPDFQVTEKGSASSDGSAGTFPPSKRTAQTCQNMLELFHNVDQSAEHGMSARFNSSDRDTASVTPEVEGSDASVARQWQNQSTASQGFGLRLAPPSQRAQHSSQIVNGPNSRQINSKVEERSQVWLGPHEISQRERWDNSPNISGQTRNETSQLNMQATFPAALTPSHPYSRTQLQPQQMSMINEKVMNNPPLNVSNDRLASHFRQAQGAYGKVLADQSVQVQVPGATGRNSSVASPSGDTSQAESSNWSHVKISGQQFPVLESVPVSRPSAMSARPQQGNFSTMLQHVWGNASAQQHLTGGPPPKVPPNFQNNNLGRASVGAQQLEYDDSKKGGSDTEFGMCSTNAQLVGYGEEKTGKESSWKQMPAENVDPTSQKLGAFQGQESTMKNPVDTKAIASASLVAHPHRPEVDRGRFGKDPALVSQKENVSFRNPATSTRDIEAFGRSLRQASDNYSLLHQVQAMKSVENNLDKRGGKRFKGADGDADLQPLDNKAGQQLLDGGNTTVRDSSDNGSNAAVQHTSFPSRDSKMLNFSSESREDQNANTASQIVRGVVPSQDMVTHGRIDSHNHSRQHSVSSIRPETSQINPKMAPTWFDRYGSFRPEQILPTHDALSAVKPVPQQLVFGKGAETFHTNSSNEPAGAVDASQDGNICQSTDTTMMHNEDLTHLQSLPSDVTDQTLAVVRPKKRKTEKLMLAPWHKEITCGSQKLQTISMAELDWSEAANRLVDKMEDEAEVTDDGHHMIQSRRRLIFTTQLMQQILRPPPAEILAVKATSDYETVTYSVSKQALGEACGLLSSSETDAHQPKENNESGKLETSETRRDNSSSKVVEVFIGRAKKLETDLLRLDKRASVMDIRVECQDLERFSVINRFAKFHGRSQGDETSSNAAMAQRTIPQRYVTAHAMPRSLPGGVHCLSL